MTKRLSVHTESIIEKDMSGEFNRTKILRCEKCQSSLLRVYIPQISDSIDHKDEMKSGTAIYVSMQFVCATCNHRLL